MSKLVRYKINRMPCQIFLRFVFVNVWYLSFCFLSFFLSVCLLVFLLLASFTRDVRIRLSLFVALGAGQIIFLAGINATENTVSILFIYSWFICSLGA